jgi:hypothetical protein
VTLGVAGPHNFFRWPEKSGILPRLGLTQNTAYRKTA